MATRSSTALGAILLVVLAASPPAVAARPLAPSLQEQVETTLAGAGPGPRFGLVVAAEDGRELVAIAPEQRFMPASNTKVFTTAAAFQAFATDQPDVAAGALVRLEPRRGRRRPDVVLEGHGDALLSSAPDCLGDCLAALADAVAARTRSVGDVIGDDRLFPDERWSPGMSWNNMSTSSGTAISALTLDDNELAATVAAGAPGQAPAIAALPYYEIDNRAVTVNEGRTELRFERLPGSRTARLSGTILAGGPPERLQLGIDDPADYAAWRLAGLLRARGVRVHGTVQSRHRPPSPADDPAQRNGDPPPRSVGAEPIARLTPPPLAADLVRLNKLSQNVHAELLLRRLGLVRGTGSIADGVAMIEAMLQRAGVPRADYDFADGSGMSTYNRVAPRGMVRLLRWIAAQQWGRSWRDTLPVAGIDGTLARRFRGTSLQGRLFAKTGTLNATNALSGYMIARSGRLLTFAAFANDVPGGIKATRAIDAALELVAQAN